MWLFGWSQAHNINYLFFPDVYPLETEIIFGSWKIEEMLVKYDWWLEYGLWGGVGVNEFVPVLSVSDFQKGRCEDANVVLIDGIVEDKFVVDKFLDELGFLRLGVVLIDWNLVGLNEVEKLSLDFCPQGLALGVGAEAFVVDLPSWPLLLLAHLTQ